MSLNQQAPYPVIDAVVGPAQLATNTVTLHDYQLHGQRLWCGMRVELKDESGAFHAAVVNRQVADAWEVSLVCPRIVADLATIGRSTGAVLELSEADRRGLIPGRWVVLIEGDAHRRGSATDRQEWQVTAIDAGHVHFTRR